MSMGFPHVNIASSRVYLDCNATTPLDPRVRQEMVRVLDLYGNPSSIHLEGRQARALVDEARVQLGRLLRCDGKRVVFTSGGTEANNLAVLGAARSRTALGRHIVTTAIEHSSVLNPCGVLQKAGFEVTRVSPNRDGLIETQAVVDALRTDTILVSVMTANNEIGTLQPVGEIAARTRERGILLHTDAVQAAGKIPLDVEDLGVDLLSVSSHKIYGPKGAGALYCTPQVDLRPLLTGGSHERGLRAGTENVPAIHGLGVAARLLAEEGLPATQPLRDRLQAGLIRRSMTVLCPNSPRLPNTVNFYSTSWIGESMVMAFDLEGFAVSNGSACSAGVIEPSHVILSLGYNEEVARSVVRVSLGKFTTESEIEEFLAAVDRLASCGGC
jgi:cysteine desulfurase